jgi:tetratricopeptide (TPR) repeat protein
MTHFFVSYNTADQSWAEWIAWELMQARHTITLQVWHFRPGSNFVLEMHRAAAQSDRTIAVLSPNYLAAVYTQPEWAAAFALDPTGESGTLVPVRVRECEVTGLLRQIVYLDLVGLGEDEARGALLTGLERGSAVPDAPPPFPGGTRRRPVEQPKFPGQLPPIWNVQHLRNPLFTGREESLALLGSGLGSGHPVALTQAQAIHGLGGIGKTQLAVEYAYRHAADYDIVWWLRAEEEAVLVADYIGLGEALALSQVASLNHATAAEAVRRRLEQGRERWLLVFDNANRPAELVSYLPRGGSGHVLVTSRNLNWPGGARPMMLDVLAESEAVEYMVKRTGQEDRDSAETLAQDVGYLPLALAQAAAYIGETGMPIAEYVDLFRQRRRDLLQRGDLSPAYPHTVATTWELSFRQVEAESPAAADLLNLYAFLGPDAIPLRVPASLPQLLPTRLVAALTDPVQTADVVAAVRRYSLVEVPNLEIRLLGMHRLVQAVARDRLNEEEQRKWAEAALAVISATFPTDVEDSTNWPLCSILVDHALVTVRHAEGLGIALDVRRRLLNQLGVFFFLWGLANRARELLEESLELAKEIHGPSHYEVSTEENNLGLVLHRLGDLVGAREHVERAMELTKGRNQVDRAEEARLLSNLAAVAGDQGDLKTSLRHHAQALAIAKEIHGMDHPRVAKFLSNLAVVEESLGDLPAARRHLERALAIVEQEHKPDAAELAPLLNNLGNVLAMQEENVAARDLLERSVRIGEATLPPDHPSLPNRLSNLGMAFHSLGELPTARRYVERAIALGSKVLEPYDPDLADIYFKMGIVARDQNEWVLATVFFRQAVAIDAVARGPNHYKLADHLCSLSRLELDRGNSGAARRHLQQALSILLETIGPDAPNTLATARTLARAMAWSG